MSPTLTKQEMLGVLVVTGFKMEIWMTEVTEPFSLHKNLGPQNPLPKAGGYGYAIGMSLLDIFAQAVHDPTLYLFLSIPAGKLHD